MRLTLVLFFCGFCLGAGSAAAAPAEPVFSETGPDAEIYGATLGYPPGVPLTLNQPDHLVGAYSRFDELFPAHVIKAAASPWRFRRAEQEPEVAYSYGGGYGGSRHTLAEFLARNPVTGLLIAKDDTILFEHYQYARNDRDRLLSQSMAKTITAMLIGIAVGEGAIASIDDLVATYVPKLAGTEYGGTSLRHLLHMASGVGFEESYSGSDDISRLSRDLFGRPGKDPVSAVAQFNQRAAPAGTQFHYASIETEILGLVLAAATKRSLSDYLGEKIWQPISAEADASWAIDGTGQEIAYCCFNAVLRDYARLGRLLAHDGAWEGSQLIPRDWLLAATSVEAPYLAPGAGGRRLGYGYQVWLLPREQRQFALLGIRGQAIFVDPTSKLVMVQTAVRRQPVDPGNAESFALWSSVVEQLGK